MIIFIPIFIIIGIVYFKYSLLIKSSEIVRKNNISIDELKERIEEYEKRLDVYIKKTNSVSYEDFISKINQYDKYIGYKDNMILLIKNKEEEINRYDITN